MVGNAVYPDYKKWCDDYFFRRSLASALREAGHEVMLLSPPGPYGEKLRALGFRWLPAPVRGEGAIDRLVGAIQCHQDQPCNDVSDCAGRAKACVANKCLCWMYMPVGVRLPTLTIAYAASPACEAYGYTNDGLLPRQTGGLSWTNVANTFANFRAAVRDLLRALANDVQKNLQQPLAELRTLDPSLPAVRVELIPPALYKYGIGLEDVRGPGRRS